MLLTLHSNTPVYDPARAIQLDREAIKLFPENAAYWKTLSKAYYRTGNWKASVDAMEQAIARGGAGELDPSDRFVLAMARWRLGEKDARQTHSTKRQPRWPRAVRTTRASFPIVMRQPPCWASPNKRPQQARRRNTPKNARGNDRGADRDRACS